VVLTVIGLVIVVGLVGVLSSRKQLPDSPLSLTQTFDKSPTGFTFRYPDGWQYTIPMRGLLVMAEPETLFQNQPGPTFTVQRSAPISVYGSLAEALDLYLRRGPLRSDRTWSRLTEITSSTFQGREALVVDLEGTENEVSPKLHAHIIATPAQNTFFYIMVLTAPSDEWSYHEPTLQAMLESLQILE
jgi:hypothetical protein